MTLMEATSYIIYQHAKETSAGKDIDEYWERVLPEALNFAENEIFLTFHRGYIDEPIKQKAARLAQTISPRDVGNLDNATLMLHCFIREWWLRMGENREFQTLVDQIYGVAYDTTKPICWRKRSHIRIPQIDGIARQISLSLIERYKQVFFAQRCCTEIRRRGQQNPYMKNTFVLLTDFQALRREQIASHQWLRDKSRIIAPDVGEDSLQNWLEKLLQLSPHLQIQKVGATRKAIHDGACDIRRKGGQYEHVPFDEDLTNPFPGGSAEAPDEELIADEYPKRLVECQPELEALLSDGRTDNPKQGERRFKILQLLARTPDLHSSTIATQLKTSPATICRDRKVIDRNKDRIQEILTG